MTPYPAFVSNERTACDAVLRVLERRLGGDRENGRSPEDDRAGPPIEYVAELAGQTYALEHTIVEAFDKQIRMNRDFATFVAPIAEALDRRLPRPGAYHLTFDINPSAGLKPTSITQVQHEVIEWVQAASAEMHAECPVVEPRSRRPFGHDSVRILTVGGKSVRLDRKVHWNQPAKADGRLFCGRFAPPDHETLRIERMRKAMVKKLPKLQLWKAAGARSVLVLENRDLALSNHALIQQAAEKALADRDDAPDELWLVETVIEDEWTAWCLARDGIAFPDDETVERFSDFDPLELVAVGSA